MGPLLNTVDQLARYALVICTMVFMLGSALLVSLFSADTGWRIVRSWSRLALGVFGVRVECEYEESASQLEGGGVIVGLTQQSLLDPTAGYAVWDQRVRAIWNIEYAMIPFFGWVTVLLGWIIVRQLPEQAKQQLGKAAQHAADGGLVYLSAEGRRSEDGSLSPYKKGPVVLAIEAQAPIHPCYISGSRDCLPVGEWKIKPGTITLRYFPPIVTAGLGYDDRDRLLQQIRAIGEAEHRRCNNGVG